MSPAIFLFLAAVAAQGDTGSFVIHNFRFASGEVLPELRLHYRTLGRPRRDAAGRVRNAVLVLHGTGGSGAQFLSPLFAGGVYDAGQPLDTAPHYLILPDKVGHGRSSQPRDGVRARFPRHEIGRGACRGRGEISVGGGCFKKKNKATWRRFFSESTRPQEPRPHELTRCRSQSRDGHAFRANYVPRPHPLLITPVIRI